MAATKSRPINFSTAEVKAILSRNKTQVRSAINPQPAHGCYYVINGNYSHALQFANSQPHTTANPLCVGPKPTSKDHRLPSPYGRPGDQLWVRESWRTGESLDGKSAADMAKECEDANWPSSWTALEYGDGERRDWDESTWGNPGRRRASITMPRWASRIDLEVLSIRIERLHDMTEADAVAEGAVFTGKHFEFDSVIGLNAKIVREMLWARTQVKLKRPAWGSNPWTWVMTFKLHNIIRSL